MWSLSLPAENYSNIQYPDEWLSLILESDCQVILIIAVNSAKLVGNAVASSNYHFLRVLL